MLYFTAFAVETCWKSQGFTGLNPQMTDQSILVGFDLVSRWLVLA